MITLRILSWPEAQALAYPIRLTVFVEEQGVPKELELDEEDVRAWHALALDNSPLSNTLGTARLQADGKIGRLAVLAQHRGHGIGSALMNALLGFGTKQGIEHFYLHAQTSAMPFYERFGFKANGPIFNEAGIKHVKMMY